jgi:hypothetical protein
VITGDNNTIQGNFIGTDPTGTIDEGNSVGISITSGADGNLIGGTTPGARNIISGNHVNGITLSGASNTIQGNYIGTDVTGMLNLGNGILGIHVSNTMTTVNNLIGGTSVGAGNIIAFNDGLGIGIGENPDAFSSGNAILGNFIHSNHTDDPVAPGWE